MIAVAVLLNNYFHDLSVALFTCALLGLGALWRAAPRAGAGAAPLVAALDRLGRRIAAWSFAGIVVFGAVRAVAFRAYEWLPAAARGIVPALAVKHVVLVALLGGALASAASARRKARVASEGVRP